ncbi:MULTISPECIES: HEPN domain-containing protein [pseudomallei group]|uniref:HEPN domain-containing protein n=1 Tax=pseudomallei group TaxID=111527 RepID=UPI0012AEDF01|nr:MULTISPECIES: HEPN domain-containing protein [pseudomallei group]
MKLNATEIVAVDALVDHLCEQVDNLASDPLRDRYIGFCAVTIATHLETLIKSVVLDFCDKQNRYLHAVLEADLAKFNARIRYKALRDLLARFDTAFEKDFVRLVNRLNQRRLASGSADIFAAYESLLNTRHSFVHNLNASFANVTTTDLQNYLASGKRVASAFARSLVAPTSALAPDSGASDAV